MTNISSCGVAWQTCGRAGPHNASIFASGRRGDDKATRPSRAAAGYQHVPFAYAPPLEQDRQAERRLRGDAFRPEVLCQPSQPVLAAEPAQRDRGQAAQRDVSAQPSRSNSNLRSGEGSAAATRHSEQPRGEGDRWQLNGQAGSEGASAGAAGSTSGEDDRGGRRQKKKERHKRRRRAARERERDRRSSRSHDTDVQPSDTDSVVSERLIQMTSATCNVLRSHRVAGTLRQAHDMRSCDGARVGIPFVLALMMSQSSSMPCKCPVGHGVKSRCGPAGFRTGQPTQSQAPETTKESAARTQSAGRGAGAARGICCARSTRCASPSRTAPSGDH